MSSGYDIDVTSFRGYDQVTVHAGQKDHQRIVPPAGEDYAFTVDRWTHNVIVSVSPTGRSVRVWVNGEEFKAQQYDGEATP